MFTTTGWGTVLVLHPNPYSFILSVHFFITSRAMNTIFYNLRVRFWLFELYIRTPPHPLPLVPHPVPRSTVAATLSSLSRGVATAYTHTKHLGKNSLITQVRDGKNEIKIYWLNKICKDVRFR